jgi:hypothetical protein
MDSLLEKFEKHVKDAHFHNLQVLQITQTHVLAQQYARPACPAPRLLVMVPTNWELVLKNKLGSTTTMADELRLVLDRAWTDQAQIR